MNNSSLAKAIRKFNPLSQESEAAFLTAWKDWELPKDFYLLREKEVSDYIYFIERNCPYLLL
jgi:hypothetical protein